MHLAIVFNYFKYIWWCTSIWYSDMAQVHKKSIADAVTENSQKQYQAFQFHIDETNQTSR